MTSSFEALVLCYHAISDRWEHALAMRQNVVERQLAGLLARGYRPVPAEQVMSGRAGDLHVTFDDAYRSVVPLLPTLQRLGIPATIFVSSDYADEGRALAVPELAAEVAAQPDQLETLDWSGLRELAQHDVEIGSHTLSHAHLTQLSDVELERELGESRERVADEIHRPCRFFAYPYGEHDSRVRSAVKAAGYEAAFALHASARPLDPYAVPRVGLYRRDGRLRSRLKLSGRGRSTRLRRRAH
jgi:peptidoglycan/xylan/chitin deacetylase (PgdA/CDA1 family)